MLYLKGNRHRRSTHACVGGLEGQDGLPSTHFNRGVKCLDTRAHLPACVPLLFYRLQDVCEDIL